MLRRYSVSACIANRKETEIGKLLHTFKVSKAYFELGDFCSCSEAVNVLEAQPVFTVRVTKAIDIAGPVAVEVHRAIHSPLDDLPLSVLITEHLEWPTTTWVNGVHSRDGAATTVHLLAVTREIDDWSTVRLENNGK